MTTDDPIDVAWSEVQSGWDDEDAHRRFLLLCQGLDRLGDAGQRYRAEKEARPDRSEMVDRQVERLLGLAMQRLGTIKTEVEPRRWRGRVLLFACAVSGTMMLSAIWLLLRTN